MFQKHAALWRVLLVLGGGLVVTFGSDALGFHEAGSVGCIVTAFTAAAGWRSRESPLSVVGSLETQKCRHYAFQKSSGTTPFKSVVSK